MIKFTRLGMLAAMCVMGASVHATETLALKEFSATPKYCLFFTVDGLDRDYISTETTPQISALIPQGTVFPDAINVYPTLTTPNMTSILTGAFPWTTTIGSNQVFLKDEKKIVGGPRFNKAETIAESFKKAGGSTAAVQHFMLQNRGADRYVHTGTKDSRDITTTALSMLEKVEDVPTLMAVLYQTVDSVGHLYGEMSPEVLAETKLVDGEMAKIIERYREFGILQDTLIVVSSDHGMSPPNKNIDRAALHKAVLDGGWTFEMLVNTRQKPSDDVDLYFMAYGNLQCYFNREFSLEEQERLFQALESVEGIGRIYDSLALRRMGAHPNAGDFIVEPAIGWWLGGGGGTHGRNAESDGFQMMVGAGVAQGAEVMSARTVDLMPTVLEAFSYEIPETVDGKVLRGALRN